MSQILKFEEFITKGADGVLTTDSLRVASVHGKRHDNLVVLIRQRIAEAGDRGVLEFKETYYIGSNGETYPMFHMTKDGYQFLEVRMQSTTDGNPRWSCVTNKEIRPRWHSCKFLRASRQVFADPRISQLRGCWSAVVAGDRRRTIVCSRLGTGQPNASRQTAFCLRSSQHSLWVDSAKSVSPKPARTVAPATQTRSPNARGSRYPN